MPGDVEIVNVLIPVIANRRYRRHAPNYSSRMSAR
jgi:hypothetical protein